MPIPKSVLAVAESGIRTFADVERLAAAGFRAMLVGEALVTSGDHGNELLGGGHPEQGLVQVAGSLEELKEDEVVAPVLNKAS